MLKAKNAVLKVENYSPDYCYYMMALGYLGKGMKNRTGKNFEKVLEMPFSYCGAILNWIKTGKIVLY